MLGLAPGDHTLRVIVGGLFHSCPDVRPTKDDEVDSE
jgi:hypothetical protein